MQVSKIMFICEKAKLYTDEQADKMEKSYVNVNNEGGFFVSISCPFGCQKSGFACLNIDIPHKI